MILLISDTHIPSRADWIPSQILKIIYEKEPSRIFCMGDLTDEKVLEWLEGLGKAYVVKGNVDYLDFPRELVTRVQGVKVALVHSDQIWPRGDVSQLNRLRLGLGAKILFFGHTHQKFFQFYNSGYLINPGSATGAWAGSGITPNPSVAFLNEKTWEVEFFTLKGKKLEREVYRIDRSTLLEV